MAELRLGLLGGTFNPIHVGHLVLAESFRERLGLDRVLFVPAGLPPHKSAGETAPSLDRYAMTSLAVAGHPAFEASDLEVRRPGPSYTVDTVEAAVGRWPGARLFLLMGSDTFLDLPTWRTPERLLGAATLAVGARTGSGFDPDARAARAVLGRVGARGWLRVPPATPDTAAPGDVLLLDVRSLPVSAQEIRGRLASGQSVRYLVPLAVADYLGQRRLYAGG